MKNIYQIIVTINMVAFMGACDGKSSDEEKPAKNTVVASMQTETEVESVPKQVSEEVSYVRTKGYVEVPPENKALVSSFYEGHVQEIKVLPGSLVSKGDVLFSLQSPLFIDLQLGYLQARQELNYLKEDFERQEMLSEEEITSKKRYARSIADYQSKIAEVSAYREKLKLLGLSVKAIEGGKIFSAVSVYAPFSGNVTKLNIQKGSFLAPQDISLELVNTEHLHLELEVFESDISKIRAGQKVIFSVPEMGPSEYEAEVYLVVPMVDMEDRTSHVHCHIDETDFSGLLPGMYIDASIQVNN